MWVEKKQQVWRRYFTRNHAHGFRHLSITVKINFFIKRGNKQSKPLKCNRSQTDKNSITARTFCKRWNQKRYPPKSAILSENSRFRKSPKSKSGPFFISYFLSNQWRPQNQQNLKAWFWKTWGVEEIPKIKKAASFYLIFANN